MCFVTCDIAFASYGDNNTPDAAADSIEDATRKLKHDSIKLFK